MFRHIGGITMKPNLFNLHHNEPADSDLDAAMLQEFIEQVIKKRHSLTKNQAKARVLLSIEDVLERSDCECQGLFKEEKPVGVFVHSTPMGVN
jgi:hypothetical protein